MNERPKILVVYYTQTGQLKRIIDHVLAPLEGKADITFEQLVPVTPFPFPWGKQEFYDTMPETIQSTPRAIQPIKVDVNTHFDLVIMAYQPWFLSPSQPTAAFLQSEAAKQLLKGKKSSNPGGQQKYVAQCPGKSKKLPEPGRRRFGRKYSIGG
jgi:hypothetical protein